MDDVQIRQATEVDSTQVWALCRAMMTELVGAEHVEALLPVLIDETGASFGNVDTESFFVAETQDGLVACGRVVVFEYHPLFRFSSKTSHAYIELMYTIESRRAEGIGARIVQALEAWAAARGIHQITLHAAPEFRKFYERAGYEDMREMTRRLPG